MVRCRIRYDPNPGYDMIRMQDKIWQEDRIGYGQKAG
jgi:hypothetical protein